MTAALPSLAKLQPNPHWARLPLFDRKGWRTMAFGEFAESVNERVEPSTAAEETETETEKKPRSLREPEARPRQDLVVVPRSSAPTAVVAVSPNRKTALAWASG